MEIKSELEDIPSAVTTSTNYNNNYNKQIERTALQIREGEQLLDIDKALLIPAGISKQVFSKNPFLLTKGELDNEEDIILSKEEFNKIKQILKDKSIRDIATDELDVSKSTVSNWFKNAIKKKEIS